MSLISSAYHLLPRYLNNKLAMHGLLKPAPPINVTFSVTNLCNSKCRTCSIWKVYPEHRIQLQEELTLEEIEKVFQTIGTIYFFNISGGEPFLRKDLVNPRKTRVRFEKARLDRDPDDPSCQGIGG